MNPIHAPRPKAIPSLKRATHALGTGLMFLLASAAWAAPVNVAQGKLTNQSSTFEASDSSRAVDGNTNGQYSAGSVAHTNLEAGAWWAVNLGASHRVEKITLWNRTDGYGERLSNFHVDYLDAKNTVIATKTISGTAGESTDIDMSVPGVYSIKVQLNGTNYLSLAEVQVLGTPEENVALGKPTDQSSTYSDHDSSRAVDGNTTGNYNTVTYTDWDSQAYWKVDLGASYDVSKVTLWNRTDNYTERLSDFHVDGLDASGNVIPGATKQFPGTAGAITDIDLSASGVSAIRVQLNGTTPLSLAEVQVYGMPTSDAPKMEKVAEEGQTLTFNTPVDLVYGANNHYAYKRGVTGSITFDSATFGDPRVGGVKAGYRLSASHPNPTKLIISPAAISLKPGDTQVFTVSTDTSTTPSTASRSRAATPSVTWKCKYGVIDPKTGLYTAKTEGTDIITATSDTDPGAGATTSVSVAAAQFKVTVNNAVLAMKDTSGQFFDYVSNTGYFAVGDAIYFKAKTPLGQKLVGWQINGSDIEPPPPAAPGSVYKTLNMPKYDVTLTAINQEVKYTVTIGNSSSSASPAPTLTGSGSYYTGSEVWITATSNDPASAFDRWDILGAYTDINFDTTKQAVSFRLPYRDMNGTDADKITINAKWKSAKYNLKLVNCTSTAPTDNKCTITAEGLPTDFVEWVVSPGPNAATIAPPDPKQPYVANVALKADCTITAKLKTPSSSGKVRLNIINGADSYGSSSDLYPKGSSVQIRPVTPPARPGYSWRFMNWEVDDVANCQCSVSTIAAQNLTIYLGNTDVTIRAKFIEEKQWFTTYELLVLKEDPTTHYMVKDDQYSDINKTYSINSTVSVELKKDTIPPGKVFSHWWAFNTPAYNILDPKSEKTTVSMQSTMYIYPVFRDK